jgi:hypothetical protein
MVRDQLRCEQCIVPSLVAAGCCAHPARDLTEEEACFFRSIDNLPTPHQRLGYERKGRLVIGCAAAQDPLDSGRPGTQWHRILLFGEVPGGCVVRVGTLALDELTPLRT